MSWTRVVSVPGIEVLAAEDVVLLVESPRLADFAGISGVIQRLAPAVTLGPTVQTVNGMFTRGRTGNEDWLVGVARVGLASAGYAACGTHEPSTLEIERFVVDNYLESAANALAYLAE